MANVVKFEASGKEYALSIREHAGRRWLTAQQLGEALGNVNINKLIRDLAQRGELQEEKHWKNFSFLQPGDAQARVRTLLSYRGVIRVSMHSEGTRARQFRDWAEEVLYQVMKNGQYDEPQAMERWREMGFRQGLAVVTLAGRMAMSLEELSRICYLRRVGLSQPEVGRVVGRSKDQLSRLEREMAKNGITFDRVNAQKRGREMLQALIHGGPTE